MNTQQSLSWRGGLLAAVAILLLSGSSALAQNPPVNQIGLVFDPDYLVSCEGVPTGGTATMYIVLLEPDFSELRGWEAALHSEDELVYALYPVFVGGGENLGSRNEFRVTFADPLPTTSRTILCSFDVLSLGLEECLYLTGVSNPSLADPRPLVWPDQAGPTPIQTYHPFPNGTMAATAGCASIPEYPYSPCENAVAVARSSWGALKARYR